MQIADNSKSCLSVNALYNNKSANKNVRKIFCYLHYQEDSACGSMLKFALGWMSWIILLTFLTAFETLDLGTDKASPNSDSGEGRLHHESMYACLVWWRLKEDDFFIMQITKMLLTKEQYKNLPLKYEISFPAVLALKWLSRET